MKIQDVIYKGSKIDLEKSSLFLADSDFKLKKLPINKNSLVYYNSVTKVVNVNWISYGIFQRGNIPQLISDSLPSSETRLKYAIDKNSSCPKEETILNKGGLGIWHENHFDKWPGHFKDFRSNIERSATLHFDGIEFSSFMYCFNASNGSLFHFINVKPIELNVYGAIFYLPAHLEININEHSKGATVITLEDIIYFDIKLKGVLQLSETGLLEGSCSEEFSADIFGHPLVKEITISEGFQLEISSTGKIKAGLLNPKTHKVEYYEIRKSTGNRERKH